MKRMMILASSLFAAAAFSIISMPAKAADLLAAPVYKAPPPVEAWNPWLIGADVTYKF